MKQYLYDILPKLDGLMTNEERLRLFNRTFHEVLAENAANVNCTIIDEDGNIQIENLKRVTDKLGMGSLDFYRKEKDGITGSTVGKCIKIPSKDMLLLIAVCLELDTDAANLLLRAAGYGNYLKNLQEFIIFCGLNNIKSIDDVSGKLFQYGFREQAALMTVSYNSEKDTSKKFSEYFFRLCDTKGCDKKKILGKAGLVSAKLDPEQNKYYYNAFYGQKSVKILLDHGQVMRLFKALNLSISEKMDYLGFLLELDVIHEDSVKTLLEAVDADAYAGAGGYASANPQSIDHNSVFTQYISTRMDHLHWDQLDGFISQTFGSIRSFAVFYSQLLRYDGFRNVADFCSAYELSTKSHYNYVLGITLPELTTLTAFSFLFRGMTVQIYNTLLKKAGKYVFDNNEDSVVYVIAKELLARKKTGEAAFGDLYDLVEFIVATPEYNKEYLYEDLGELYLELVKIVSRNLLAYARDSGPELNSGELTILKTLAEKLVKSPIMNYSDYFCGVLRTGGAALHEGFAGILRDKLGFSDESPLIVRLKKQGAECTEAGHHG
ncbi:MAG: hypothetical protein GXY05_12245 [Clostridiales bacterium]|nr:hypothetical protein [Clostridiales bacterium]